MEVKVGHCKQCGNCCFNKFYAYTHQIGQEVEFEQGDTGIVNCQTDKRVAVPLGEGKERVYCSIPVKKCHNMIKKKGKCYCKLHNKPEQPRVCRDWPYTAEQDYYKSVNLLYGCGYWFYNFDVECPQPLG